MSIANDVPLNEVSLTPSAAHGGVAWLEWIWLLPVVGAIYYPWALQYANRAHLAEAGSGTMLVWLASAYAVPIVAFLCALRAGTYASTNRRVVLARRLCCLAVATPPAFTLIGVLLYLMKINGHDIAVWTVLWLALAAFGLMLAYTTYPEQSAPRERGGRLVALRGLHGVSSLLLILLFLAPHLFNHSLGVFGTDVHREVMEILRTIYRNPFVEPSLMVLFLFQILSGLVLIRPKTAGYSDFLGTLQVTSGAYLAMFIPTHVNSVFTLARYFGTETDYAWAVGEPVGLLADAWNIRLVPHYSLAVFLLIAHLACGLRIVMKNHGVRDARSASTAWWLIGIGGCVSAVVTAGMLGWRIA